MSKHLTTSAEREGLVRSRARSSAATAAESQAGPHPLLDLQRQVGNSYVQRMLAQRQTAPEDVEPEVGREGGPVSAELESRVQSMRGTGAPLDSATRTTMESAFDESFDRVRLHRDSESDTLNRSLGARAFTTGNDIFLGRDASPSDQALLGHELTHVVQQRDGAVSGSAGLTVGPADDAFEQAADEAGAAIAAGSVVEKTKREGE